MSKNLCLRALYTVLFLIITVCILTNSRLSLYYAYTGLELWYRKMVPALLPFMVLSGVMVRMGLTEGFTTLVYPFVYPLFRVRRNVCYVMTMGFLCGFPMGAKCVAELHARGMLDQREAEFLLAFCNNIGPVYFCSFVLPLLSREKIAPYVFGMYGLPLLYGLLLRYTRYRDIRVPSCSLRAVPGALSGSVPGVLRGAGPDPGAPSNIRLLEQLDDAIFSALQSMFMLGGYMILFNLLYLLPHLLLGGTAKWLAPLFEITGGLQMLGKANPLYSLVVLPFGGLSCTAQTYSCIKGKGLSVAEYVLHKLLLTAITLLYYLAWARLFPGGFLA